MSAATEFVDDAVPMPRRRHLHLVAVDGCIVFAYHPEGKAGVRSTIVPIEASAAGAAFQGAPAATSNN